MKELKHGSLTQDRTVQAVVGSGLVLPISVGTRSSAPEARVSN